MSRESRCIRSIFHRRVATKFTRNWRGGRFRSTIALTVLLFAATAATAQVNVTTYKYDNGRTGQNLSETVLTPSNVNSTQFGKLFSHAVDGQIYAQPLYIADLTVNGSVHNVVFVATENDSVYAFDADSNAGADATYLWHANLVDTNHGAAPNATALNSSVLGSDCNDLTPIIGITATPVIDPMTNTMYVETQSAESGGYVHRLHALDITTGAEKAFGPVVIDATVSGTGDGSVLGPNGYEVVFSQMALTHHARPGLLLMNGTVYVAFASHCDLVPYHGWLFAYNEATLAQQAVFLSTPNGGEGGFWMSGAGIAADSNGNIFIATGNGTFDTANNPPTMFGDTILKLALTGNNFTVLDYFTPWDQNSLSSSDTDLGSGGVLLVPQQSGTNPRVLVEAGKEGTIYVVNRDQMTTNNTHYCATGCSSDPEILQEFQDSLTHGLYAMPSYWNGNVYVWGLQDNLRQYSLSNGTLSNSPVFQSNVSGISLGSVPTTSSSGNTNAILWATRRAPNNNSAILYALDATMVSNEFYDSTQAANNRDLPGNYIKFTVPIVANGKVYIGTDSEVDVYGLLGQVTATPQITPASENFTGTVPVSISDSTTGATIYYTTDGSIPLPGQGTTQQYTNSFNVTQTTTVNAMATATGISNSATATAIYNLVVPATVSSVSPSTGSTTGGTQVTITGANFVTGATATFGGAAATNVVVLSSTQITATTPAGSVGAVTVTVTNPGVAGGSLANGYTYAVIPTVASISPNNGPAAGGTPVTITGTNFAAGASVTIGGTPATNVVVVSATQITATTPAGGAGSATVTVTVNGQSGSLTNGFTYNAAVPISFGQVAAATPQSPTATVAVTFPAAQTAGDLNIVVVGWNDTISNVNTVQDSQGNNYSLAIGPTVGTALQQSIYYAANIAGGNNTVTVTFNQSATAPDVRILEYRGVTTLDAKAGASGNNAAPSSGPATTTAGNELIFGANTVFTLNLTPGSGFTSRIITTPDGDLAEDQVANTAGSYSASASLVSAGPWVMQMVTFSAVTGPAPTVISAWPNTGTTAGGTPIAITGTNFAPGASVTIGGAAATNVVVVSSTQITATTPAGAAGAATVTVTANGQAGSLANGFTYVVPPTVTAISPNAGTTAGGTPITITGTNFAAGVAVTIGGGDARKVVVVSATQITATTPAGSEGPATVTVTVDGLAGNLTNGFTYDIPATVSSVSPSTGSTGGGTPVTITGTDFVTGATVTFGSNVATNVVVVSSTQITATAPAGTAGAVTITVTNPGVAGGSLANGFTYIISPAVSNVSPNNGPTAGGTAVTITGTNFAAGATVTFGANAATNVVVVSGTQITATTPAGSAGAVTVAVTVNAQTGSLTNGFTYTGPPTVTSISPNNGPVAGGTQVTITGTNFAAGATVTFGSNAASNVVVVSGTQITATTPAGSAGAVTVTVTVNGLPGSLANGFTYNAVVAIGFGQVAAATPQSPTATVAVAFPGAQTAGDLNIVVIGWNDTSSNVNAVRDSQGNTYNLAIGPTVGTALQQSIYYASNIKAGSNTVTVTFNQSATAPDVRILEYRGVTTLDAKVGASGSNASPSSGSATTTSANELIFGANTIFTTTKAAGSGFTARIITSPDSDLAEDKIVTTAGSNSATASLNSAGPWVMQMVTFTAATGPAPTVTSISPNNGPAAGGTPVTITGTNFASGASLTIGGAAATNVVVVSSTQITATTPAGTAGAATVTVTANGQAASLANGFTYIAAPTVTSVAPSAGTTAGGTSITIAGANFAAGATVTLGGNPATNVVVVNTTQITATTPAGGAGPATITVAVNGQAGSLTNGFTYDVPATVGSVSPNTGSTGGGTSVTITGTNFVTGATVTFGSNAATNVVVLSSTQLTATTPTGTAGGVTVTVTNPGVAGGSLTNAYSYVVVPTVTSISPNSGPMAGGTSVTIAGTNFAAGATVTFGGNAATNVVVVSGTQITATTPVGSAGAVTVTVTVNGQSGSLANGFTYNSGVAIGFGQVAAATPQSPTATVAVAFPGGQTAGDLNIVVVGWNDTAAAVSTVKDSAGNTYNLAIGPTAGTALQQSIYYASNIKAGSNTVTVTFSQAAASVDVRILEYRGVTTLDAKAGASGSNAAPNSGSATTTSANELIFGANTVFTTNKAAGSGFTARIITSPDSDLAEDKIVTTAGGYSATASLNSSGPWVMQMVTFK